MAQWALPHLAKRLEPWCSGYLPLALVAPSVHKMVYKKATPQANAVTPLHFHAGLVFFHYDYAANDED